jgi:hypothetical protein
VSADIFERSDLEVVASHHDDWLAANHDRHKVARFRYSVGRACEHPISMPNVGDLKLEDSFVAKQIDRQRGTALYSIGHALLVSGLTRPTTTRSNE